MWTRRRDDVEELDVESCGQVHWIGLLVFLRGAESPKFVI